MANISGTARTQRTSLFTGIVRAIPIGCNPTKDELLTITSGSISFKDEIKYDITYDNKAFTAKAADWDENDEDIPEKITAKKIEIWCKVPYNISTDNKPFQPDNLKEADFCTYVKYTIFSRNELESFAKGTWYIDPVQCKTYWVDTKKSPPKNTHQALIGEKSYCSFIAEWLNIIDIDLKTSFEDVTEGDVTEIQQAIEENLNAEDVKAVKLGLYAKLGTDGNRGEVYQTVWNTNVSDALAYKKMKENAYFNKQSVAYSLTFKPYSETLEENTEEAPNAHNWGN